MPDTTNELERYRIGDLLLDVGTRKVTRDGREITLPGLSFDLLLALTRHAPNVISIDELMDEVWAGRVVNAETVTKRVEMVRHALGDDSHHPRYIALVRRRAGFGAMRRVVASYLPVYGAWAAVVAFLLPLAFAFA